ncbi:hypothetical protein [Amycolatopsis nigrescens]|uniref:hypothetical protein n=1 Tax=Amycolatopsis nigrescens TaxID=381445 RepID=UPI00037E2432|nr:hypothetical protein [Amycolatopsis nigrescens]
MLQGMATVFADDLDAAKRWYAELLGIEPYPFGNILAVIYNPLFAEIMGQQR